jgi:hypothetical protein
LVLALLGDGISTQEKIKRFAMQIYDTMGPKTLMARRESDGKASMAYLLKVFDDGSMAVGSYCRWPATKLKLVYSVLFVPLPPLMVPRPFFQFSPKNHAIHHRAAGRRQGLSAPAPLPKSGQPIVVQTYPSTRRLQKREISPPEYLHQVPSILCDAVSGH